MSGMNIPPPRIDADTDEDEEDEENGGITFAIPEALPTEEHDVLCASDRRSHAPMITQASSLVGSHPHDEEEGNGDGIASGDAVAGSPSAFSARTVSSMDSPGSAAGRSARLPHSGASPNQFGRGGGTSYGSPVNNSGSPIGVPPEGSPRRVTSPVISMGTSFNADVSSSPTGAAAARNRSLGSSSPMSSRRGGGAGEIQLDGSTGGGGPPLLASTQQPGQISMQQQDQGRLGGSESGGNNDLGTNYSPRITVLFRPGQEGGGGGGGDIDVGSIQRVDSSGKDRGGQQTGTANGVGDGKNGGQSESDVTDEELQPGLSLRQWTSLIAITFSTALVLIMTATFVTSAVSTIKSLNDNVKDARGCLGLDDGAELLEGNSTTALAAPSNKLYLTAIESSADLTHQLLKGEALEVLQPLEYLSDSLASVLEEYPRVVELLPSAGTENTSTISPSSVFNIEKQLFEELLTGPNQTLVDGFTSSVTAHLTATLFHQSTCSFQPTYLFHVEQGEDVVVVLDANVKETILEETALRSFLVSTFHFLSVSPNVSPYANEQIISIFLNSSSSCTRELIRVVEEKRIEREQRGEEQEGAPFASSLPQLLREKIRSCLSFHFINATAWLLGEWGADTSLVEFVKHSRLFSLDNESTSSSSKVAYKEIDFEKPATASAIHVSWKWLKDIIYRHISTAKDTHTATTSAAMPTLTPTSTAATATSGQARNGKSFQFDPNSEVGNLNAFLSSSSALSAYTKSIQSNDPIGYDVLSFQGVITTAGTIKETQLSRQSVQVITSASGYFSADAWTVSMKRTNGESLQFARSLLNTKTFHSQHSTIEGSTSFVYNHFTKEIFFVSPSLYERRIIRKEKEYELSHSDEQKMLESLVEDLSFRRYNATTIYFDGSLEAREEGDNVHLDYITRAVAKELIEGSVFTDKILPFFQCSPTTSGSIAAMPCSSRRMFSNRDSLLLTDRSNASATTYSGDDLSLIYFAASLVPMGPCSSASTKGSGVPDLSLSDISRHCLFFIHALDVSSVLRNSKEIMSTIESEKEQTIPSVIGIAVASLVLFIALAILSGYALDRIAEEVAWQLAQIGINLGYISTMELEKCVTFEDEEQNEQEGENFLEEEGGRNTHDKDALLFGKGFQSKSTLKKGGASESEKMLGERRRSSTIRTGGGGAIAGMGGSGNHANSSHQLLEMDAGSNRRRRSSTVMVPSDLSKSPLSSIREIRQTQIASNEMITKLKEFRKYLPPTLFLQGEVPRGQVLAAELEDSSRNMSMRSLQDVPSPHQHHNPHSHSATEGKSSPERTGDVEVTSLSGGSYAEGGTTQGYTFPQSPRLTAENVETRSMSSINAPAFPGTNSLFAGSPSGAGKNLSALSPRFGGGGKDKDGGSMILSMLRNTSPNTSMSISDMSPVGALEFGLRRRRATIMIASFVGFLRLSQDSITDAHTVSQTFLQLVLAIIDRHGGVILRISADKVIATWNAFRPERNHEDRAAKCAIDLNRTLRAAEDEFLLPDVQTIIVVTSGTIVTGNAGTTQERVSVAQGACMDLAHELLTLGAGLDIRVLTTQPTVECLSLAGVHALPVDLVTDEQHTIVVYALKQGDEPSYCSLYKKAFEQFRRHDYQGAQETFSRCLSQHGSYCDPSVLRLMKLCVLFSSLHTHYLRAVPAWQSFEEDAEQLQVFHSPEGKRKYKSEKRKSQMADEHLRLELMKMSNRRQNGLLTAENASPQHSSSTLLAPPPVAPGGIDFVVPSTTGSSAMQNSGRSSSPREKDLLPRISSGSGMMGDGKLQRVSSGNSRDGGGGRGSLTRLGSGSTSGLGGSNKDGALTRLGSQGADFKRMNSELKRRERQMRGPQVVIDVPNNNNNTAGFSPKGMSLQLPPSSSTTASGGNSTTGEPPNQPQNTNPQQQQQQQQSPVPSTEINKQQQQQQQQQQLAVPGKSVPQEDDIGEGSIGITVAVPPHATTTTTTKDGTPSPGAKPLPFVSVTDSGVDTSSNSSNDAFMRRKPVRGVAPAVPEKSGEGGNGRDVKAEKSAESPKPTTTTTTTSTGIPSTNSPRSTSPFTSPQRKPLQPRHGGSPPNDTGSEPTLATQQIESGDSGESSNLSPSPHGSSNAIQKRTSNLKIGGGGIWPTNYPQSSGTGLHRAGSSGANLASARQQAQQQGKRSSVTFANEEDLSKGGATTSKDLNSEAAPKTSSDTTSTSTEDKNKEAQQQQQQQDKTSVAPPVLPANPPPPPPLSSAPPQGVVEFRDVKGMVFRMSERSLGKGANGEVLLGMTETGGLVAIKSVPIPANRISNPSEKLTGVALRRMKRKGLLANQDVKQDIEEVLREVSVLSKLRHENIVGYLSSAIVEDKLLVVMEYISGGSLTSMLAQFKAVPVPTARRYLRDVLKGLEFLHKERIVHRDIKPHNVLLLIDGSCKLTDFGTSTSLNRLTSQTGLIGTPQYMSPEAAQGTMDPGGASDIWSFGILMAELLTGDLPYGHILKDGIFVPQSFLYMLGHDDTMVPSLPDSISPEAAEVIKACCQRDPKARPNATQILTMPFFAFNTTLSGISPLARHGHSGSHSKASPGAGSNSSFGGAGAAGGNTAASGRELFVRNSGGAGVGFSTPLSMRSRRGGSTGSSNEKDGGGSGNSSGGLRASRLGSGAQPLIPSNSDQQERGLEVEGIQTCTSVTILDHHSSEGYLDEHRGAGRRQSNTGTTGSRSRNSFDSACPSERSPPSDTISTTPQQRSSCDRRNPPPFLDDSMNADLPPPQQPSPTRHDGDEQQGLHVSSVSGEENSAQLGLVSYEPLRLSGGTGEEPSSSNTGTTAPTLTGNTRPRVRRPSSPPIQAMPTICIDPAEDE